MDFVRKAEEALTGKNKESKESTQSSNHGPHSSNLANKLDPRVDSDRDNRAAHTGVHHTGATGTTGTTGATTGATTGTTGTSTAGHNSSIANKLDPRVDADAANRANVTSTGTTGTTATHGAGTTHGTHSTTGTTGLTGTGTHGTHTHGSTNAGPHDSKIANKVDPRVDSDRDNRAKHDTFDTTGATHGTSGLTGTHGTGTTHGTSGLTGTHGTTGTTGTTGTAGLAGTHAATGTAHTGSANVGPHDSKIANKLDPRVDSDRDNRAKHDTFGTTGTTGTTGSSGLTGTHGTGTTHGTTHGTTGLTGTGTHGTYGTHGSTNVGPHDSNIANKVDPRVDSDLDNRAQHHSHAGTGIGGTTHGTHGPGSAAFDPQMHGATATALGTGTGTGMTGSGLDSRAHGAPAGSSYTNPTTATTGGLGSTGTTGLHDSKIANKLDPRVDSDTTRVEQDGLQRQF